MALVDWAETWHAISAHFASIPQSIRLMVITAGKCTSFRCSVIGLSVTRRLRNLTKHCSLLPRTQQNTIVAPIVFLHAMADRTPHPVQLPYLPHQKSSLGKCKYSVLFISFFSSFAAMEAISRTGSVRGAAPSQVLLEIKPPPAVAQNKFLQSLTFTLNKSRGSENTRAFIIVLYLTLPAPTGTRVTLWSNELCKWDGHRLGSDEHQSHVYSRSFSWSPDGGWNFP